MKLRDVLPSEFFGEFMDTPAAKLLDEEVKSQHDDKPWVGSHKHVYRWWTLENGKRVAWNENPAKGWSFPVA